MHGVLGRRSSAYWTDEVLAAINMAKTDTTFENVIFRL